MQSEQAKAARKRMEGARWFIARTEPCRERVAAYFLKALHDLTVYLPFFTIVGIIRGVIVKRIRTLFPGYIFVKDDGGSTRRIRNTPGVAGIVLTTFQQPARVSQSEIERVMRAVDDHEQQPRSLYKRGQTVRTASGLDAVFLEMNGATRARIMLSLFARRLETNVPLSSITSVT